MTDEELNIWFFDKFNSCYTARHDYYSDDILFIYDISHIRRLKINKINNEELKKIKLKKGTILFQIDTKRNILYCNDDIIWSHIYNTYSDYHNTQSTILKLIKNNEKLKNLIPFRKYFEDDGELKYIESCSF